MSLSFLHKLSHQVKLSHRDIRTFVVVVVRCLLLSAGWLSWISSHPYVVPCLWLLHSSLHSISWFYWTTLILACLFLFSRWTSLLQEAFEVQINRVKTRPAGISVRKLNFRVFQFRVMGLSLIRQWIAQHSTSRKNPFPRFLRVSHYRPGCGCWYSPFLVWNNSEALSSRYELHSCHMQVKCSKPRGLHSTEDLPTRYGTCIIMRDRLSNIVMIQRWGKVKVSLRERNHPQWISHIRRKPLNCSRYCYKVEIMG